MLRQHQIQAINSVKHSIKKGLRRPLIAAACSFGKTYVAASILKSVQDRGNRGMFICDRVKLVQQTLTAFDNFDIDFGVMQGIHERSNPSKTVQIASIQTLQSWSRKRAKNNNVINEAQLGYEYLSFDLFIIDECHITYGYIKEIMDDNPRAVFIGLSATPYSKGLGNYYNDLIVPITPRQLEDKGYLTPIKYYGGASIDTKGLKTKALKTGGSDYNPKDVAKRTEDDTELTGDIVKNWIKYGRNGQTIAFSPSIKHSKYLVEQFIEAGVPSAHIDGYMDDELRQELYEAHDKGEIKILSCSQLLNTGYDAPSVECLIDCYPTKSIIVYCQRAGRIARKHHSHDTAVYLDHAGNFKRHGGAAEDIVPDSLDYGEKKFNEKNQIKEKKEAKTRDCPVCYQQFVGLKCSCGYEIPITEQLETDDSELVELTPQKRNKAESKETKQQFYSELLGYCTDSGKSTGWAAHTYRQKYSVWPNAMQKEPAKPTPETINYIRSRFIAYAKSNKRTG